MNPVTSFRDRVVEYVREQVPELREVDWYDGVFDIEDLRNWSAMPPCAFVAITSADQELVSTGEVQADLGFVVVVIDQDRDQSRDADERVWDIIVKMALKVRLQRFGEPNASPADRVKFRRLKDPVLRREGVALGIVTWVQGLTFGDNAAVRRDEILDAYGQRITQVPRQIYADFLNDGFPGERIASEPDLAPIPWPGRIFKEPDLQRDP